MEPADDMDRLLDMLEKHQKGEATEEMLANSLKGMGDDTIRSSNDSNPAVYSDPSGHYTEKDGRSISTLLPTSKFLGGTVIPRSTRLGRSKGCDPYKPGIINIDPHISGQSSVIDLAKLDKEVFNKAVRDVAAVISDPNLAAAVAFRKVATSLNPVNQPEERMKKMNDDIRVSRPHVPGNYYVAPRASLGGGQQGAPIDTPVNRKVVEAMDTQEMTENEAAELEARLFNEAVAVRRDAPQVQPAQNVVALFNKKSNAIKAYANNSIPTEEVTFAVEGFGHLTTVYHRVIRDDINLVLVYDNGYPTGQKFFPAVSDKPLIIDVHSHNKVYKAIAPGIHFNLDNYEIFIMLIEEEADK